jgi:hypothetical protein
VLELLEARLAPAALTVTSTLDDGSAGTLRAAIAQANTDATNGISDIINFDSSLSGATIVLAQGQLELSGAGGGTITIDGSSLSNQLTISGNNASRVFLVDAKVQSEFDNLTITSGTVSGDSGGGIANNGTLTVTGCSFSSNSAYIGAGIDNTGKLTIGSSTFNQNTAGYYGAGIANEVGATLTISQGIFSNNSARDGAGINSNGDLTVRDSTLTGNAVTDFGGGFSGGGSASFDNTTFYGNSAGILGGGINEGDGTLTLRNCNISGNTATLYGGGMEVSNSVTTVSDCTITGNTAQVWFGGGIASGEFGIARLTVSHSTFSGNSAHDGGGINSAAGLTVNHCTFTGNAVVNFGGGISASGTASIGDSTFSGNSAGFGAGINEGGGTFTINHCVVSGNNSSNLGGGIENNNSTTIISDCTISGNTAANFGGAISNGDFGSSGPLTIDHSTLSTNQAGLQGGGIYNLGTLTIDHGRVCGNSAPVGPDLANYGTATLLHSDMCGIANFGTLTISKPSPSGPVTEATYTSNASAAQYQFHGFQAPVSSGLAFGVGRTIPIKFQLTNTNAQPVTNLTAVTSLQAVGPSGTIDLTSALHFDTNAKQFVANWQTKGLPAGDYSLVLILGDGTTSIKYVQLTTSSSSAGLTTDAAGGTTAAPGGLLAGNIELYVDNSNGDLTTDELDRIQDAVTAVDAVTERYGVAVQEVTDPSQADVILNMDTTSAVGGYASGVLGCTTGAGQITIISGWNFYAGRDATQIGSTQYDFETVVIHELGHALGLGHSADSTSVMYATLNTGAVNRVLTAADLNVPDTDAGACGLHASPSYLTWTGQPIAPTPVSIQPTTVLLAFTPSESSIAALPCTEACDLLFTLLAAERYQPNVANLFANDGPSSAARDALFSGDVTDVSQNLLANQNAKESSQLKTSSAGDDQLANFDSAYMNQDLSWDLVG